MLKLFVLIFGIINFLITFVADSVHQETQLPSGWNQGCKILKIDYFQHCGYLIHGVANLKFVLNGLVQLKPSTEFKILQLKSWQL